VHLAVALAEDESRRAALRVGMREQLRQSPLMDAPRFAGHMESAYRQVWRRWTSEFGKVGKS